MENPAALVDNPVDPAATKAPVNPEPASAFQSPAPAPAPTFSWKAALNQDFANSPTILKFPDTKDGFNDAVKSHLSLEKMLGHEKIPVPKGKDDVEAWAKFGKAFNIPDKAEGYSLPDIEVPESMKGAMFDKKKFAETVHEHKLTPEAAKGLWNDYTDMAIKAYGNAVKAQEEKVTAAINQMRGEWGDAYQSKIELGQMVINKFSDNKEVNDYVTAVLAKDPNGIRFLAKVGDQFAENKIGDFKYQRHALTPEEAQREVNAIRADANHPYNNPKASDADHNRAVDYVNTLIGAAKRTQG